VAVQIIVYSLATGRVRRVEDPQANVPNVVAYLAQVPIVSGEARIIYNKQGNGADTAIAWQLAVNAVTGKSLTFPVDATAPDWYCGIDQNGLIQWWGVADPACGDQVGGLTLINAPYPADGTYSYLAGVFTAPVIVPPVKAPGGAAI
jgi:hypothetical protein